jgi:hypothetical protein
MRERSKNGKRKKLSTQREIERGRERGRERGIGKMTAKKGIS